MSRTAPLREPDIDDLGVTFHARPVDGGEPVLLFVPHGELISVYERCKLREMLAEAE